MNHRYCGPASLRTGTSLIAIVVIIVQVAYIGYTVLEMSSFSKTNGRTVGLLIISIFDIVLSITLLKGALTGNKKLVSIWYYVHWVILGWVVLESVIVLIMNLVNYPDLTLLNILQILLPRGLFIEVLSYFLLVVHGLQQELKKGAAVENQTPAEVLTNLQVDPEDHKI